MGGPIIALWIAALLVSSLNVVASWRIGPSPPTFLQVASGIALVMFPLQADAGWAALDGALKANEVTYSSNAKNFQRMGEGDFSQGRRDISTSYRATKRRAMAVCKSSSVKEDAGVTAKGCNQRVLADDEQFISKLGQVKQQE